MSYQESRPLFEDFDLTLDGALNSTAVYDNSRGASSIGFTIAPPSGATVSFEGSFNGSSYFPITMRSQNLDLYTQSAASGDDFIGSVAALRFIRWKVTVAGSGTGSISGRTTAASSTIEGQEHGFPPHKRGFLPVRKDFEFTAAQTGAAVWTPALGKKFVITSFTVFGSGTTDSTVTLFDETNTQGNRLMRGFFDVSINAPIYFSAYMGDSPFISGATNNVLKYTSTAAISVFGALFGYEIS